MKLSELKVGDKVFRCMSGWGRHLQIATVEKVGKLHIMVLGSKFRVSSGMEARDYYSSYYIEPFDQKVWDEYQAEMNDKKIRQALADFDWKRCDKELALKAYELLPKVERLEA